MGFIERRNGRYRASLPRPARSPALRDLPRASSTRSGSCEKVASRHRAGPLASIQAVHSSRSSRGRESFLSLARRLSPTTQQTYRRDLTSTFSPLWRLPDRSLPTDEIEKWLMTRSKPESRRAQYTALPAFRRVLQVAVEKEKILAKPVRSGGAPHVPSREMVFLSWKQAIELAEAHRERFPRAHLSRGRLGDALERAHRLRPVAT